MGASFKTLCPFSPSAGLFPCTLSNPLFMFSTSCGNFRQDTQMSHKLFRTTFTLLLGEYPIALARAAPVLPVNPYAHSVLLPVLLPSHPRSLCLEYAVLPYDFFQISVAYTPCLLPACSYSVYSFWTPAPFAAQAVDLFPLTQISLDQTQVSLCRRPPLASA